MDIDFIKWMVEYSEGFKFKNRNVVIPGMAVFSIDEHTEYFDTIIYPLLLQRAIEGIIKEYGLQFDLYFNKKTQLWDMMFYNKKNILYSESNGLLPDTQNIATDNKNPDEAKVKALKYIYEQEKKS